MSLVIPAEHAHVRQIMNRLGGTFEKWLRYELEASLIKLSDSNDEVVMRQMQGRCRLLRDLLSEITAAQQ